MSFPELTRPATLDDAEWQALTDLSDRMRRAHSSSDWSLVVGTAKELCEAVAKQVIEARGGLAPTKYDALLTEAHRLIDRQPGEGLASDESIRAVAGAVKRIAIEVGALRRSHGTGHGRTVSPEVLAEHAEVALESALLWCRWALRRLDVVVEGRAVDLVRDLRQASFFKGDLARRLIAADLPSLEVEEQRRLGLAVGRRASRQTFNVLEEGVVAAAGDGPWTSDYRQGVVEGVFIDEDGHVRITAPAVTAATRVLAVLEPEVARQVVQRITRAIEDAEVSYAVTNVELNEGVDALQRGSERLGPTELRLDLGVLAKQLAGLRSG